MSRRTEKAYLGWIRRFLIIHRGRHPRGMGAEHVGAFLSDLAVRRSVSPSTQNQALAALLFLFREVLEMELPRLDRIDRAHQRRRLPEVLSREEVRHVLGEMDGVPRLMATLLYGSGIRLLECCRLRVKDLDLDGERLVVREGKGGKGRVTPLPAALARPLRKHLRRVREQHETDLRPARVGWKCYAPSTASCPGQDASGNGSGSFRRPGPTAIPKPVSAAAIICMRPCCRRKSGDGAAVGDPETGHLPHLPPFLCHSPAPGRLRHPHGAGASRPQQRPDDHDLNPRDQEGRCRGSESSRPAGMIGSRSLAKARIEG